MIYPLLQNFESCCQPPKRKKGGLLKDFLNCFSIKT
jgi:hypothetical protein